MDPLTLLLPILVLLISYYVYTILFYRKKLPPGPFAYPIVGNSYLVKNYSIQYGGFHKALVELCKLYKTNVIRLTLGGSNLVVIQTDKLVDEGLSKDEFLGRPNTFFTRLRCMGTRKGITMTEGEFWQEQRSFAMKQLQNLGFGKKTMECLIHEEIQNFINKIHNGGSGLSLNLAISRCVINVLWTLVTGSRFDSDESLDELLNLMSERSKAFDMAGGLLSQFPWIRFIAPEKCGYNIIKRLNARLKNLISKTIEEHKETYSRDKTRDFIDSFLHEMHDSAGNAKTTFTDDQLIMVCLDFFIAGSMTTSATIDFLFLHMLLSPDVQEKAYQEISSILKPGQLSSLEHKEQMPYVHAVILENERFTPCAPIAGPRRAMHDVNIGGYTIPKNSTVLFNLYPSTNDANKWEDPGRFNPSRFLRDDLTDENNKLYTFGKGKRRCPGEKLGKGFIFLFFTSFLNYFKLIHDDNSKPILKCMPGMVISPVPYRVTLVPRHKTGTEYTNGHIPKSEERHENGTIHSS